MGHESMSEAQKQRYRAIVLRSAEGVDLGDPAALETMYERLVVANEALIARKAGELRPDQAQLMRDALREVIDEHREALGPPLPDGGGKAPLLRPEDILVASAPANRGRTGPAAVGLVVLSVAVLVGVYGWTAWNSPYAPAAAVTFNEPPDAPAGAAKLMTEPWPWASVPPVAALDDRQTRANRFEREGDVYTVTGEDPQLVYDVEDLGLGGAAAPYLGFDFACKGTGTSSIQIFWWGDGARGPSARPSAVLEVWNGRVLVPLGASPSWSSVQKLAGIRIDPENRRDCDRFTLRNVALHGPPA